MNDNTEFLAELLADALADDAYQQWREDHDSYALALRNDAVDALRSGEPIFQWHEVASDE
jgi:hypothetical protein